MSDTFIVDVKGTRLNIREIYLEEKKYIEDTLDFSKKLLPKGVEGKSLLKFARTIPLNDLELMSKAIEANCEKVDPSEW